MQHEVPVFNLCQLAVELLIKFHFDYLVDFRSVSANSKNRLLGPGVPSLSRVEIGDQLYSVCADPKTLHLFCAQSIGVGRSAYPQL